MSDLTEALEKARKFGHNAWQYDFGAILKAARKFAALTSPETIEKGTQVVVDFIEQTEPVKVDPDERAVYRDMVEAVLRAVAGVEEGNSE